MRRIATDELAFVASALVRPSSASAAAKSPFANFTLNFAACAAATPCLLLMDNLNELLPLGDLPFGSSVTVFTTPPTSMVAFSFAELKPAGIGSVPLNEMPSLGLAKFSFIESFD